MTLLRTLLAAIATSVLGLTASPATAFAIAQTDAATGATVSISGAAASATGSTYRAAVPVADPTPAGPKKLFTIRDERVDESSGLAKSQKYEGIWWTVNDSGDTARVFGIDATGRVKAELSLNAPVRDVEAIAVDRDGTIYIADIGDNRSTREMVAVYTIPEPDQLGDQSAIRYRRYDFVYPDGAHDAETLLIAPETRRMYFVTKVSRGRAGIYAAPEEPSREGTNELTKLADAPAGVTDGTFMPDGRRVVLRSYVDIAAVAWGEKPNVVARAAAPLAQGESVAVGPSGTTVIVGSEGENSAVYEMAVPVRKATAQPTASPKPAAAAPANAGQGSNLRWIIIGAAVFALIVTIITFPPGRRERLDRMAENARLTGQPAPNPHGRRRST